MTRPARPTIGIFGWGVVAPGAKDMAEFRRVLSEGRTKLGLDRRLQLGTQLFAVGDPSFDLENYRHWIVARDGEPRYAQVKSKLADNTHFAMGATIQALESNPGLEAALRALDTAVQVLVGSGVGDLPQSYAAHESLERASAAWNRFWAHPTRCAARRAYETESVSPPEPPPVEPSTLPLDSAERWDAVRALDAYWAQRSDARAQFERAYAAIEQTSVGDDVDKGPLHAIRARQRAHRKLIDDIGCPAPPWTAVDPRLIWAIQNVPASQISMMLGTHGAAWAPVAACSTFGVCAKLAVDAIERGEATAVIFGTADPRPDPALIAAFHRARLAPAAGTVNMPLTSLLGTHVSGGACIWIVADVAAMAERGLKPIGPTLAAAAVSSDAEHIITPSVEGPKSAIRTAIATAEVRDRIGCWDLHATGTPGDVSELKLVHEFLGPDTKVTARKGLLGHGMANAGGWELTALALSLQSGRVEPTGVERSAVHPTLLSRYGAHFGERGDPAGEAGVKVMLGIGGVTACVVMKRPT